MDSRRTRDRGNADSGQAGAGADERFPRIGSVKVSQFANDNRADRRQWLARLWQRSAGWLVAFFAAAALIACWLA